MAEKSTVYAADGVSCGAVLNFMKKCSESGIDIHSFEIIKDGEIKARIAPKPYSFDYKQQLYSLSKSFSSTAIGFLIDEGKVDLEDKVVDIFAEKCPKNVGENMKKMRLKNVLSLNTGHKECQLEKIRKTVDPVKAFLETEPELEPGTHFCYNNAATYMLSAIVNKCTGMTMFDFLSVKLFKPLGIEGVYWDAFPDGNSQGAVGLHASCDDLIKLGLLYLNKGVYKGRRLLSEEWVENASKFWSDNSSNGTPDWTSGYGFQFWLNAKEGFRGDGAFGQLCVILPSKNMVVATEVYSSCSMQEELNYIYAMSEELFDESDISMEELSEYVGLYNKPKIYNAVNADIFGKTYHMKKNAFGITMLELKDENDAIVLEFSNGSSWQKMNFGKNCFKESRVMLKKFKPTLEDLAGTEKEENVHFAAYCTFEDETLKLYFNYLDCPHVEEYALKLEDKKITMKKVNAPDYCFNEDIEGEEI